MVVDFLMLRNHFSVCEKFKFGLAVQLWGWFAQAQESRIEAAKRSEKGSSVPQSGWIADSQESRFIAANCSYMGNASCKGVDYLLNRNLVFRLRMVQIWAVPSCKRVQLLMLRNRVFSLRIVQICVMQSCKREMSSFFGISFSGCEMFSYEECHIRRRQICWCTVITYSGCEILEMCSAEPLECWSAGAQESRFHSANRSNMGNAEM